jgi:hypothetical protein
MATERTLDFSVPSTMEIDTAILTLDWIRLTQDRYRWQAALSAVMNLRVIAPRSYLVS